MNTKTKLSNTIIWGFLLWFAGYLAGIVLFFIVPKEFIGWVITPFATTMTIWVLVKKVKRPKLLCYFGTGLIWILMAAVLDFIFLVKAFNNEGGYYKPDVFLYYILMFLLPIFVGYWKFKHKDKNSKLF